MVRKLSLIISLTCLMIGCRNTRHVSSGASSSAVKDHSNSSGDPRFINNISINPGARSDKTHSSITTFHKGNSGGDRSSSAGIENYNALQFKYAILENASVEEVNNPKLLSFMDYWYGAPYRYGGNARDGIDCSAFAFLLLSSVYGVGGLPRTSKEQYDVTHHIRRDELQEGDLVFFHTIGKHRVITHVGVYLRNNKFVHASVSGVMISDMNDGYYDKRYIGAGRIL